MTVCPVRGDVALLALDLWEHAHYLGFQNRRAAYINSFLEDLVDWDCANRILAHVHSPDAPRAARAALSAPTERVAY